MQSAMIGSTPVAKVTSPFHVGGEPVCMPSTTAMALVPSALYTTTFSRPEGRQSLTVITFVLLASKNSGAPELVVLMVPNLNIDAPVGVASGGWPVCAASSAVQMTQMELQRDQTSPPPVFAKSTTVLPSGVLKQYGSVILLP